MCEEMNHNSGHNIMYLCQNKHIIITCYNPLPLVAAKWLVHVHWILN